MTARTGPTLIDKPISKADRALLAVMSDDKYEFAKSGRQDVRLYNLTTRGLAERKWSVYAQNFAKGTMEGRYAYRRTAAGKVASAS